MEKLTKELHQEGFLTTKLGDKVNTMTIGWCALGFIWGKPVLLVMVRKSRYTYELIEKSNEFTLTIPDGNRKDTLTFCGTKSGRTINKIKEAGLSLLDGQACGTPVINTKGQHFECHILYKQAMSAANLDSEIKDKWYNDDDYHTLYFGEILKEYKTE